MGKLLRPLLLVAFAWTFGPSQAAAQAPVALKYSRAELEAKWRHRIQWFLDRGVVPLVDLESSLRQDDGEAYIEEALPVMDEIGLALIAFDGRRAPKRGGGKKGYRWGYYIHQVVNAHPDRFILATNGGTNRNWTRGKESFIAQVEAQVRAGAYPIMGEFEFRHYMSKRQCKQDRTDRDVDLPIDGANGHRLFRLSSESGVAFVIHHEPEDHALDGLERMLRTYPKATVIVAHFGQIRRPEKERRFGPDLVRRLLTTYPNLHYEISTGFPGRIYKCDGEVLDTVIWQTGGLGGQTNELKPEYKAILTAFSDRFVAGTDYGGGRSPLPEFLRRKVANLRLILRGLPETARHDIGYRNAWRLLTGRGWGAPDTAVPARLVAAAPYAGVLSDAHGHLDGGRADPDATIRAMDRNRIDKVVIFVKSRGGWTDEDAVEFRRRHPDRVVPGIGFQNKGWRRQDADFIRAVGDKARSGRFGWLGEVSFRGKIGRRLHAPPDSPLLGELLELSAATGLALTIHHNPYERDGASWRRTAEYGQLVETLAATPGATVVWAHWCGVAPAGVVRALLKRLPNLHCDLAWIHKAQQTLPNALVDDGDRLLPAWKKLIGDFPTRFLAGIDNAAKPGHLRDYDRRVGIIRAALGGLAPEVARKVATENFHRLITRRRK